MKSKVTNQYNYTLGELEPVEKFDRSKTYLKVISEDKIHCGMIYKKGLNVDVLPFESDVTKTCVEGGLYFTNLEHICEFGNYGTRIAEISIPEDSKLVKDGDEKYRTDKFKILKFWKINDFLKHVGFVHIGGYAYFNHLTSSKGFESLKSIGGDANFSSLTSSKGFESLKSIGGDAYFNHLKSSKGFESLKSIGGDAYFPDLKSSKGFESLESIGGDAYFPDLTSGKGFESLETIGGDTYFNHLKDTEFKNRFI